MFEKYAKAAIIGLLFVSCHTFSATTIQLETARNKSLAYLITQQNGDGSWGRDAAEKPRITATILSVMQQYGISGVVYRRGLNWLANSEPRTVDALARKISLLSSENLVSQTDVQQLIAMAVDNGEGLLWGALSQHRFTVLDSVLATEALASVSDQYFRASLEQLDRFKNSSLNGSNGAGWPYQELRYGHSQSSKVIPTSQMLWLLYRLQALQTANDWLEPKSLDAAHWLALQQKSNGVISDKENIADIETALATRVLARARTTPGAVGLLSEAYNNGVNYLLTRQQDNGSISNDLYKTALASQAWFSQKQTLTDTDLDGIADVVEAEIGTDPNQVDTEYLEAGNGNFASYRNGDFYQLEILLGQQVSIPLDDVLGRLHIGSGQIPNGMAINYDLGMLTGSPSLAGEFTFSYTLVRADNSGVTRSAFIRVLDPNSQVDTDGDGILSVDEVRYAGALNSFDANDAGLDPDGDGLSNAQELALGTHPGLVDSDDDGIDDATEINSQTDPLVYNPYPSFTGTPYYPRQSSQLACAREGLDVSVWAVNPDNDTISQIQALTDPASLELTTQIENDVVTVSNGRPTSVTSLGSLLAVTYQDIDKVRFYPVSNGTVSPDLAFEIAFDYGSQPISSVAFGDYLYVSLYAKGQVAKINWNTREIVSTLDVGPKPRAMAISNDGQRLLVTRFISTPDYGEVYDINTATMNFRDPLAPSIKINKLLVADDVDHGSGVANYLRSIVINQDNTLAYITANKANIDRGEHLSGDALLPENTIRPMIAVLDLVNHRDTNIDPVTRDGTHDLANRADPAAITFLPDGISQAYLFQGSNILEMKNMQSQTSINIDTGLAPQSMCSSLRTLFVKNYTDRTVKVIDIARFMNDASYSSVQEQQLTTVAEAQDTLSPQQLSGLQLFYQAENNDVSSLGYMSCASCHDEGGHDGMTWDFTHLGEGLRNTLSLKGNSGERFGRLNWSANSDELEDIELKIEQLHGTIGLIPTINFSSLSPLGLQLRGESPQWDDLSAYLSSLGKASVRRSPHREADGSLGILAEGAQIFNDSGCSECHQQGSYRDGKAHNMGTINTASGFRSGGSLVNIRTPGLVGLWDSAPYLHDGSAATVNDVLSQGVHAQYISEQVARDKVSSYLLALDSSDFIEDTIDANIDPDDDGLSLEQEKLYGTNSYNRDSDGDGLDDHREIVILGSNPLSRDTDNDGLPDYTEILYGTSITIHSQGFSSDSDGDGLTLIEEFRLGTHPFLADSDGDGEPDASDAFPLINFAAIPAILSVLL